MEKKLMEPEVQEKIKELIKRHANSVRTHYCGDEADEIASLFNHYERTAASAHAEKKKLVEDALVYFRSVTMLCESVGMASTHSEKASRLRGLIELLESAIKKLRQEQEDGLLHNWEWYSWGYSQYPYQSVLEKYRELQMENEKLKKDITALNTNPVKE